MSEFDVSNSWNKIVIACKQRNKKILKKWFKGLECSEVENRLQKLLNECLLHDDGSCMKSLLQFAVNNLKNSLGTDPDKIVDRFNLLTCSMTRNNECFEYLISISKKVNGIRTCRHGCCHDEPILYTACKRRDDIAVGILLKYGADVNKQLPRSVIGCEYLPRYGALYYAIMSYEMCVTNRNSNRIVGMLLLAGADTARSCVPAMLMFAMQENSLANLRGTICKAVRSFAENCY